MTRTYKWNSVTIGRRPQEHDLLEMADKEDGAPSSRAFVRKGRFRGSFLMATHGGATFEEQLRPAGARLGPAGSVASVGPSGEPGGDDGGLTLQNVLGAADERIQIHDTLRIPTRAIGLLRTVTTTGALSYGTAWLIGPRALATAAHNLSHPDIGDAVEAHVAMAYDGEKAAGGWHEVRRYHLPPGWVNDPAKGSSHDYAVLQIADPQVGNDLGWLGFADYEDQKFDKMIVNLFGYPNDRKRYCMYGVAGRIVAVDQGRVAYDCDAGPGMSGGPVIARFGEERVAVGVHIAGSTQSNIACRITGEAFAMFDEFRSS